MGKGLGFYLMNWGINVLRERSYKKISLWVLEENVKTRSFYEKLGFMQDGAEKEILIGKTLNEIRYVIDI